MTDKKPALPSVLSYDDVRSVSPALEHYTKDALLGGVWKRPELSPRDRSVVTVAALIARIQTVEMPFHVALALDNGVKPAELSEIITHLAFYAGWANAMAAVAVAKDIFHQRGIGVDQLPPVKDKPLPINEEAEKQRSTQVSNNFGNVSPGLVENTTDLLFRDLWLRPALAPRDRSLVTVSALIANNQTGHYLPPGPRDGQRTDAGAGFGSPEPHRVLCRLALRVLGFAGGEGRIRETPEVVSRNPRGNHEDHPSRRHPLHSWTG